MFGKPLDYIWLTDKECQYWSDNPSQNPKNTKTLVKDSTLYNNYISSCKLHGYSLADRVECQHYDQLDTVRFYDNDLSHIDTVRRICPRIKCFHVPEKNLGRDSRMLYARNFEKNSYASIILSMGGESHDVVEGLNDAMIADIIKWSKTPKTSKTIRCAKKILFDWDRTLSKVEGLLTPNQKGKTFEDFGIIPSHVMEYLLGGKQRKQKIQKMINLLVNNGVTVVILTHNKACNEAPFQDLIKNELSSKVDIMCSGTGYYRTKGAFLRAHPEFEEC